MKVYISAVLVGAVTWLCCQPPVQASAYQDNAGTESTPDLRGPINSTGAASSSGASGSGNSLATPNPPLSGNAAVVDTPMGSGSSSSVTTISGGATSSTLKGSANLTSVSATARALALCPLPRMRDEELKFVEVIFRNDSDQVALVNGDGAQAQVSGSRVPAVGATYLVHEGRPGMTYKGVAATLASAGGSFFLAGPIFYEIVTPFEHHKRVLGTGIGIDGTRHQVEGERFGLRVLMPGDETVGWMSFTCPEDVNISAVTIPVSFTRSLTPDTTLVVPVATAIHSSD